MVSLEVLPFQHNGSHEHRHLNEWTVILCFIDGSTVGPCYISVTTFVNTFIGLVSFIQNPFIVKIYQTLKKAK